MGKRLSKIFTRTGDDGSTGLGDGSRVNKDDTRIEAIGAVDELNSAIGIVLSYEISKPLYDQLLLVQHCLFDLGGELSLPGKIFIHAERVEQLEQAIEEANLDLPALKEFILPGGSLAASACHLARAICRRAERRVVSLAKLTDINPELQRYLNRLSDLLFVYCRVLARLDGGSEVYWDSSKLEK